MKNYETLIKMNTDQIKDLEYKLKSFEDGQKRLLDAHSSLTEKFTEALKEMNNIAIDFKSIQKDMHYYMQSRKQEDIRLKSIESDIRDLQNFKTKAIAYATVIFIILEFAADKLF